MTAELDFMVIPGDVVALRERDATARHLPASARLPPPHHTPMRHRGGARASPRSRSTGSVMNVSLS